MTTELIVIEIILGTIALMSALIAHEFYRSTAGNGLRFWFVALFICKVILYGGSALIYLVWPDISPLWRIALNTPMVIVMLKLWGYIRTHNGRS